jgi:hypothetical protein
MSLTAVAILVLAIGLALVARRTFQLSREIREAESRLARRFFGVQGRVTELDTLVRELEFERKRLRGEIRFEPGTRLADALEVHPRVREILGAFGLSGSGCSGGGLDESRSLAEACAAASLDSRVVLEALRGFVENPGAKVEVRTSQARIHRIQARPGAPR